MDIKGKTALVTGGATGIGLEYVKELLKNGAQNVAVADLDARKGENSVKELEAEHGKGRVIFIKTDVTKTDELEEAFKKTYSTFKALDIVINNAGILDDGRWELMIAINVNAVVRGTLLGFQYMGKDKGGKGGVVVNIASILGLAPMAGCPVYVGTKHAVVGITRSFGLPYHFDRTGVRVIAMCPGVTDTPLISEAHHRQHTSMGDWGDECGRELDSLPKQQPENVAKGMMHMIKKGSNGSIWVCEGGKPVYEVQIPDRQAMKVE
ncbi:15-hydroxyprostaglandin dehydrogenase [NAD(+)]-like [Periplaneta americana]|uniref:15-hydroxyprostaglandin dehydrogenase [NAD(+)]-like n=1 Tax=Periplaneta americana TaxID=6978 RepID=UPI0037E7555D